MKIKSWIFFGILLCLFLTGCTESFDYNSNLFRPNRESCWPCQMYAQTFQAISSFLELGEGKPLNVMASNAYTVLLIAMAFWLAFKVLPWLVSFSAPNLKEDFVQIVKVCFKLFIVSRCLTHPQEAYHFIGEYILQPIGGIFLYISQIVLLSPSSVGIQTDLYAQSGSFSDITNLVGWGNFWDGITGSLQTLENAYTNSDVTASDPMFGDLPIKVQSVIWMIYSALWMGMGFVFQLFQSNYFSGFIAGVFLGVCLFMLLIYLPLTFVDAFVRLAMGIFLLPLFAIAWVFPIKLFEGIGKKMVEVIFAAFFDILFNCIYVAFLISVLNVYLKEKMPYLFSTDYQIAESGMRQSGLQLSMDYLILVVLVMSIYKLSKRVDDITGQFFDGGGKGTSISKALDNLGKLASATAVAVVKAVVTKNPKALANVAKQAGGMVKDGMAEMGKEQVKDNW